MLRNISITSKVVWLMPNNHHSINKTQLVELIKKIMIITIAKIFLRTQYLSSHSKLIKTTTMTMTTTYLKVNKETKNMIKLSVRKRKEPKANTLIDYRYTWTKKYAKQPVKWTNKTKYLSRESGCLVFLLVSW